MNGRIKVAVAMLIWGSVGIFARFSGLSGLGVAFFRVSLGTLLLLPSMLKRLPALKKIAKERPLLVILLGTALAFNWVFLFTAFNYTTIANAVLVYYSAPVLATLISWRFLRERLSRERMTFLCMAFAGLLLIFSGQKVGLENRNFLGVLFAFIAAFFYALIPNLGRFLKEVRSDELTFFQLAIASLVLLPFVAMMKVGKPTWWAVLTLVVVHTVLALYIYMEGLKEVEVSEVALLSYLDPLSAILYAFIVFGEVPGSRTVIGGALIILASVLNLVKARGP